MRASKRAMVVRLGISTLCSLALCAAAAAAAMSHAVIDLVGDYTLARDSYDHLAHGSRVAIGTVALGIALVLAFRGLRSCCEIAAANRTRLSRVTLGPREMFGAALISTAASCAFVPAMEWLDGRADGVAVSGLSAAFGGSLLLGLVTTAICAGLVCAIVFAAVRWLIAHRGAIASIIGSLLSHDEIAACSTPCLLDPERSIVHRRALYANRISRRGPPVMLPL